MRKRAPAKKQGQTWTDPIFSSVSPQHLRQHRAAEMAVGIAERLGDLEVVVALGDDELDALAGFLERLGEVARLALELGRLDRAVVEHDRRADALAITLRRE